MLKDLINKTISIISVLVNFLICLINLKLNFEKNNIRKMVKVIAELE